MGEICFVAHSAGLVVFILSLAVLLYPLGMHTPTFMIMSDKRWIDINYRDRKILFR